MSSRGVDGPLLLDTHVWIWLMEAVPGRLGPATRALVDRVAVRNGLRVSAMSTWEVAMLESRGRVSLTLDCRAWMRRSLRQGSSSRR